MAMTVGEILSKAIFIYNIRQVAGNQGMNKPVSWVSIVEDDDPKKMIYSNEMVLTSGMKNTDEHWLLHFVQSLNRNGLAALLIRIGKMITIIPNEVLEYCNDNNIPTYIIPEKYLMVDVFKDIIHILIANENVENDLITAFKSITLSNENPYLIDTLSVYGYHENDCYCPVLLTFHSVSTVDFDASIEKLCFHIEMILNSIKKTYVVYRFKQYLCIVLINFSDDNILDFSKQLNQSNADDSLQTIINVGIGKNQKNIKKLHHNFEKALLTVQLARYLQRSVLSYEECGIYKIFMEVNDTSILEYYYHEMLFPILEYDRIHKTDLVNFLTIYFQYDCNVQHVSDHLFIHRNTANNKLRKIEQLTGCFVNDSDWRANFHMAFKIKEYLDAQSLQ